MAKNQYISGVGGWLRLLIVGLTVLGPLLGFSSLSSEFRNAVEQFPYLVNNAQWLSYKQAVWIIFSVSVAISFSAGYRLWTIYTPKSVRFAILALWLSGPLGNFSQLTATVLILGPQASSSVLPEMLGGILGSCTFAGIWTAYLKRSVRVRNTYNLLEAAATAESTDRSSQLQSNKNQTSNWWRRRSKGFRLWCFTSLTWATAVFLFVLAFDPYNNGSWAYMDDDEYFNMFSVMFVPPLFIGAVKYAYEKWVK